MALLRPGNVVATDTLTYPGFKVLAHALRLALGSVSQGVLQASLEQVKRVVALQGY